MRVDPLPGGPARLAGSAAERRPGGAEVLAGLDDALGHAGLAGLAPGAGVVLLLVADLAVDLQHAVVVGEHVRRDGAGEGVLGVGVDVHLHHAEVDGVADLLRGRARAAVEDEVEGARVGAEAELRGGGLLRGLEDLGAQLDVAGLVDAVHVAEGQGGHVATALAGAERLDGGDGVLGGRVELVVDLVGDTVLLAADDADLDLEDDVGRGALGEQLLGDLEVLVEGHGRAVPHVRLEQRRLAAGDPLGGDVEQRADEAVELVLGAVVGVQRDVDRVVLRDLGGVGRERDGAGDHVLHRRAGQVLRAAGRDLDDAVGAGVGEALERGVEGLGGRHVDGRVGEGLLLRGVQHLCVHLGSGDGHLDLL